MWQDLLRDKLLCRWQIHYRFLLPLQDLYAVHGRVLLLRRQLELLDSRWQTHYPILV